MVGLLAVVRLPLWMTLFLWGAIHQRRTSKGDVHLRPASYLLVLIRPHKAGAFALRSLIDVIVSGRIPNGAGGVFSNDSQVVFSLRICGRQRKGV